MSKKLSIVLIVLLSILLVFVIGGMIFLFAFCFVEIILTSHIIPAINTTTNKKTDCGLWKRGKNGAGFSEGFF